MNVHPMHIMGMTLQEFMAERHLKDHELEDALGVSRSMITKLRLRIASPSFETARRIVELSEGRIALDDLMRNPPAEQGVAQ